MKVRHDGKIYEQVGYWTHPCGAVFRVLETAHEFKLVPAGGVFDTCEEIKDEPRWQDVTGECDYTENVLRHHGAALTDDGYRLRKVRLDELLTHNDKQFTTWAFLVERKVSE